MAYLIVVVDCIKNVVFELSKCEPSEPKIAETTSVMVLAVEKITGLIRDCIVFNLHYPQYIQGPYHTCAILLQWILSFGTSPFRGHKICPQKNVHIIFHYLLPQGRETLFVGPESQI